MSEKVSIVITGNSKAGNVTLARIIEKELKKYGYIHMVVRDVDLGTRGIGLFPIEETRIAEYGSNTDVTLTTIASKR
ncbi:hypothetical protein UFOVP75_154 [uncultured Caudovirales phage]|uniref:Uncharacterized protein n=1 Tax=uncultured Caudovirales phage TaxID=2100421 RepID=A0A6J5L2C5_9CAUD|nr:hypothetical protein UFOVP75_154 [uncultured Caudovirales phage]